MNVTPDKFFYFAYGSNMLMERIKKRTSSANLVGKGYVESHLLTFHKRSIDGSGKCNIERSANRDDRVYGVIFEIDFSQSNDLDDFEGSG